MFKIILVALLACLPLTLSADPAEGERLEKELWANFKDRNWPMVQQKMAQSFQSIHTDGPRTRGQEIMLLKTLNVSSYELSDFRSTEGPGLLTVSYKIIVAETIDNQRIVKGSPTYRQSVWQKVGDTWKWAAHANLTPIPGKK
ncbi:MAG: nuclear transport factor 2 family protein [Chlamydiales bacterium]|nr:nuclear transport factor 2 family protein [Chlamydiales bacterium]